MNEPCIHGHTINLCEPCREATDAKIMGYAIGADALGHSVTREEAQEAIKRGREFSIKESQSLLKEASIHANLQDFKLALDCAEKACVYLEDLQDD